MGKNLFSFSMVVLLLFISVSILCRPAYPDNKIIRLGYSDAEAFPYQIRDDHNPPGIAFEIISEAARLTGFTVLYIRLPNKRVQNSLGEGETIDGAFMFSYSKERAANGVYPLVKGQPDAKRRIATLSYYIYKKTDSHLNWDGITFSGIDTADLKNSIGANSGYSVVGDLIKKGVSVDDGSKTTAQNFLKLQSGRISGFAQQDLVADNYIQSNKIIGIEKIQKPFIQKNYFLMITHQYYKKNRKAVERLWNKIGEIRDKKTLEILPKYKD